MSKEVLNLDELNVNQLPELATFETTQKELVKSNPFVEIIDNKTYEQAKVHRTALLKGRTSLENQEKLIASKLSNFRKSVGEKTKKLIEITLPFEEKQQSEVKRWENIKEAEKAEKERLEQERIDGIKSKINEIETQCYSVIQKITFDTILGTTQEVANLLETEFDFEEYDVMFEQMKTRVSNDLMNKTNDLTQREKERKEREDLKKELFQVRVNRLKEVGYILKDDVFVSETLELTFTKEQVLECSSLLFEDELSDIKKSLEKVEQAKKDAEIKRQKDDQFVVRRNRLAEIDFFNNQKLFSEKDILKEIEEQGYSYFFYQINEDFRLPDNLLKIDCLKVYNASIIEFEQILSDAKKSIADAKAQKEAEEKAQQEAEKRAAAEQKKADAENKARVKRLANDKKIISESFEVYFADLHLETKNQETKDFIERANFKIAMIKSELLTELNEL
jgi:hypothetical protein